MVLQLAFARETKPASPAPGEQASYETGWN